VESFSEMTHPKTAEWVATAVRYICFIIILVSFSSAAFSDIYRVTHSDGTVVFTNRRPGPGMRCDMVVDTGPKARKTHKAGADLAALLKPGSGRAWHYLPQIESICSRYGLDPRLVVSVIEVESAFNPRAVSPKGAQGLMQLMPDTARMLGVSNSFDPDQNLRGGIRYLSYLYDLFDKDLSLALAAYNSGEGRVMRLGRVPRITETRNYVNKVTQLYLGPGNSPTQHASF
jgi:soluble lytic murein transglycosylase-like protein